MKCLIVGASAGLGRCLAEELAARGHDLFLVASGEVDLDALSRDVRLRHGVAVAFAALDLAAFDVDALHSRVMASMSEIDALFFVAGMGSDEDSGATEAALVDRLVAINYVSGVKIVNAFLDDLSQRPKASCVGIGSIAAVRGRSSNMIYASAKRGLEAYFEAVRHRLAESGCRVQFYRAGFMRTTMLGERQTALPIASPRKVARAILNNLDRDLGTSYIPGWWRWIALVLRLMPWLIYRRLFVVENRNDAADSGQD